jgi:hypothetical protein
MTRWSASLRTSLRTHVTRSCVTRARVTLSPRLPLVFSPIAPPTRVRAVEALAAAAAAARRARVASMTRRDAARHRALLRTPVRRPHASLARASSRISLPSFVVPPLSPTRARARRRRRWRRRRRHARTRRLDDATARVIARIIARAYVARVRHSSARYPDPPRPSRRPPCRPL